MKTLLLSLILIIFCIPAFAGDQEIAEFNAAYWASQPPAVLQMVKINDTLVRESVAVTLALQGVQIDKCIMIWNWSPWHTMFYRLAYGYTWIPSFLQIAILSGSPNLFLAGRKV